tara:strand:- start:2934 stop:3269 length:336 start_codon:yes stop_codon:yes gene_type:complete
MRINKTILAAVAGASLLAAQSAFAQQPSETTETYGNWTYRCSQVVVLPAANSSDDKIADTADASSKKVCETVQSLQNADGNVIAQIAFGLDPVAPEKVIAVFQVPQGTLLS